LPRFLLDSTKRASRRGLLGKLENIAVYLILFFLCFAAVILAFPANGQLQGKEIQVISAFLAGGDIAVLCVLWRLKRLDPKTLMFLLFLLGVLMRLSYAAAYPAEDRQHDVFDADGHLQYILRLADTWRLPDSNNWQYNHPPLHHLLAAVWVKVFQWFGVTDQAQLAETLQFLTCFYSCAMLAVVYRIFDENPFGRRAVPLAYALVCLHPTFYLLAGSLNNDCLMVLLFFTAVLYTLRWYRDPSLKRSCVMYDELTEVDIKKMQEEINYRTRVLRPQLIEEVQTARAFGDLSENYEYKCAKQAKNRNDSRIRYLERMIRTAKVIEVKDQGDRAGLFDKVTIYNELAKQEMTLQIVTTLRQDALKGLISKESPVGKALLGRQVGDRIQVEVSPEVKYWVEIRAIEKGRDDESLEISSY